MKDQFFNSTGKDFEYSKTMASPKSKVIISQSGKREEGNNNQHPQGGIRAYHKHEIHEY